LPDLHMLIYITKLHIQAYRNCKNYNSNL